MLYIKQYGCKRTGTNYMKALLEKNFSDIIILMNTLGGKHDHPVDLIKFYNNYPNDPFRFVAMATQAHPAENLEPFNSEQIEFINQNAVMIANAVLNNRIHYLVTIKNPYSWINSNKEPYSWINSSYKEVLVSHGGYTDESRTELLIKLKSKEFNSIYNSYRDLSTRFPEQTTIARYEDVLADHVQFLNQFGERLKLTPNSSVYSDVTKKALPTRWDQQSTPEDENETFLKNYYLDEQYFEDLPSNIIEILEAEIDWDLMKYYGYFKRS